MIGLRVVSPYFVAGVEIRGGRIVRAAPILYNLWMGRDPRVLARYCDQKGWGCELI